MDRWIDRSIVNTFISFVIHEPDLTAAAWIDCWKFEHLWLFPICVPDRSTRVPNDPPIIGAGRGRAGTWRAPRTPHACPGRSTEQVHGEAFFFGSNLGQLVGESRRSGGGVAFTFASASGQRASIPNPTLRVKGC